MILLFLVPLAATYTAFMLWVARGLTKAQLLSKPKTRQQDVTPVSPVFISVVIAARNEAARIGACLESLAAQTNRNFEVIVADDASDDGTGELILNTTLARTKTVSLQVTRLDTPGGKRAALHAGIAAASGEVIACTDADCVVPPAWIEEITGVFADESVGFVSMPVIYSDANRQPMTPFERAEALDFLSLVGVGAASVFHGRPSICNGANLAYRKAAWQAVGGFADARTESGDDEQVMRKIFRAGKYRVKFHPALAATVYTSPTGNWRAFLSQRTRWASKGAGYGSVSALYFTALVSVFAFNLVMLVSPLWAWLYGQEVVALGAMTLKLAIDFFALRRITLFFGQRHLMRSFAAAELLQLIYVPLTPLLAQLSRLSGGYRWKGRRVL